MGPEQPGNLTKTNGMVVKGKVERPSPIVTFDIKDEVFLKLLGVYFHTDLTNWDKQIDAFLSKAGRRIYAYITSVPVFNILIIPLFFLFYFIL